MSYVMDFEERSNLRPDDSIIEYEGFNMGTDLLLMLVNCNGMFRRVVNDSVLPILPGADVP